MAELHEDVIKVPGNFRGEFLNACKDPGSFGLRVEAEDGEGWVLPTHEQATNLFAFCAGHFAGAPSRQWKAWQGARFGYNREGVFLHECHLKRFFGICRENASVALRNEVPEALPEVSRDCLPATSFSGNKTEQMLSSLMTKLPTISHDMRHQVLRATFEKADLNKNNVLSRPEVASMFRKVVMTMSAAEVEALMSEADKDMDRQLTYQEFCDWLESSAPDKVKRNLERCLGTEADVVKASFRVWDANGDGLISKRELHKVLAKMCRDFAPLQVKSLCELLDADKDGNVDYDEFVDFLFYKHKRH